MSAFAAASMACDSRRDIRHSPRDHSGRWRMKALSYLVSFVMAICALVSIELRASATAECGGSYQPAYALRS
jgi:hypothetical protein